MGIIKIVLGAMMGGVFGFAGMYFGKNGDWGMVGLTVGIFIAFYLLILWIVDVS